MGHKIRPDTYRLGVTKDWDVKWLSKKSMAAWLEEDEKVRDVIMKRIGLAGVSKIEIERLSDKYKIVIKASRPGLIIGRGGKGIEDLTKAIEKVLKTKVSLSLNVEELKRTELSAKVAAQNMAWDIEKRTPFRRVMKKSLESFFQHREVQGAKVQIAGRLNGSEIARTEWLAKGKLPLSTLRANVDYGQATAFCTYGAIGIKVWIYKGEIFEKAKK